MRLEIKGEYPPNRAAIHDEVRAAAGNRCIRCGHPQGDRLATDEEFYAGIGDARRRIRVACDERCSHPKDEKLRVLTVHHLDGDKSNSRWWNLLALCQSCHLKIQGKVIPGRPWLFAHSAWFRPYVAGYYAYVFGGLELTRADVERAFDKYLAMGQPWLYDGDPSRDSEACKPRTGTINS